MDCEVVDVAGEVWLRPNLRALWVGIVPPVLSLFAGMAAAVYAPWTAISWIGWALVAVSVCLVGWAIYLMRQPRLAYRDGHLLVFLRAGRPIRVPIDLVECFFLSQGPTLLPKPMFTSGDRAAETSTVVVRLAASAAEWKHLDVRPALGNWADGYITIRGTWCEPLSSELVKRLNERLVELHRQRRRESEKKTA